MKSLKKAAAAMGAVALLAAGVAIIAPSAANATGTTYGTMTVSPSGPYVGGETVTVSYTGLNPALASPPNTSGGGFFLGTCIGGGNPQLGPGSCSTDSQYFFGATTLPDGSKSFVIPVKGSNPGFSDTAAGGAPFDYSTWTCGNGVGHECNITLGDFKGNGPTQIPIKYAVTSSTTLTATGPGATPTLDAAVTLADSTTAAGTVQFTDGSTDIGSPVTVDASGHASTTSLALSGGTHSLHAVYTPADTSVYVGSTGTTTYASPALDTSTALTVTPTTAAAFSPVVLHADVTPSSAAGSVRFFDGATQLCSKPATTSGADCSVGTFTTGAHSITAQFVPTNPAAYNPSSSLAVDFTATAPSSLPAASNVKVAIAPGTLTITTPYTNPDGTADAANPLDLGTASLTPDGQAITVSRPFHDAAGDAITVEDLRAGNPGWSASAVLSDFSDGSGHSIPAGSLSITGLASTLAPTNAPMSLTLTDLAPLATTSQVFATAAAGGGAGTVSIDGQVHLAAPPSTLSGSYTATLTLTVI